MATWIAKFVNKEILTNYHDTPPEESVDLFSPLKLRRSFARQERQTFAPASNSRKGIYHLPGNAYVWVRGAGSVPDVPHAANVSFVTEGSGVGVSKEPPVNVKVVNAGNQYGDVLATDSQSATNLCFEICVAEGVMVTWETIFMENKLYVEVPNTILPEGSKESLVTLLEYAEEELDCTHVILCFKKSRNDRASLIRTFMFLGFTLVTPGDPIVPNVEDLMFLVYTIDSYDTD